MLFATLPRPAQDCEQYTRSGWPGNDVAQTGQVWVMQSPLRGPDYVCRLTGIDSCLRLRYLVDLKHLESMTYKMHYVCFGKVIPYLSPLITLIPQQFQNSSKLEKNVA